MRKKRLKTTVNCFLIPPGSKQKSHKYRMKYIFLSVINPTCAKRPKGENNLCIVILEMAKDDNEE